MYALKKNEKLLQLSKLTDDKNKAAKDNTNTKNCDCKFGIFDLFFSYFYII